MQEAIKAVIEYGFKDMNLNLIEAFPNPNISKSIRVLARNNFIRGDNFDESDSSGEKILEGVMYNRSSKDYFRDAVTTNC